MIGLSKPPVIVVINSKHSVALFKLQALSYVVNISLLVFTMPHDAVCILTVLFQALFYVLNIELPAIFLSIMSLLVFTMPHDAGEKNGLAITVLLSFSVFMLMIADLMPTTSTNIPILGEYILALASLSLHVHAIFIDYQ